MARRTPLKEREYPRPEEAWDEIGHWHEGLSNLSLGDLWNLKEGKPVSNQVHLLIPQARRDSAVALELWARAKAAAAPTKAHMKGPRDMESSEGGRGTYGFSVKGKIGPHEAKDFALLAKEILSKSPDVNARIAALHALAYFSRVQPEERRYVLKKAAELISGGWLRNPHVDLRLAAMDVPDRSGHVDKKILDAIEKHSKRGKRLFSSADSTHLWLKARNVADLLNLGFSNQLSKMGRYPLKRT